MYKYTWIPHTYYEVIDMYLELDIQANVEVNNLCDLPKLKQLMENLKMKINRSKLGRELGADRRTINKYLDGFTPKKTRLSSSKFNKHFKTIMDLLSTESDQVFYYKRVLWQYLIDNHDLKGSQSAFGAYINRTPEFKAYFDDGKRTTSSGSSGIRYETKPGEQA